MGFLLLVGSDPSLSSLDGVLVRTLRSSFSVGWEVDGVEAGDLVVVVRGSVRERVVERVDGGLLLA